HPRPPPSFPTRRSSDLLLHDRQVAAVRRVMDRARPAAALEVAPGPGRLTRDVRPAGSLTCLEFNEGMIAQGRRVSPPGTRWVRGDRKSTRLNSSHRTIS